MNTKPRHEYEATDINVDALPEGGAAAIHFQTTESIDLTVLLTMDQLWELSLRIEHLLAPAASPSDPQ